MAFDTPLVGTHAAGTGDPTAAAVKHASTASGTDLLILVHSDGRSAGLAATSPVTPSGWNVLVSLFQHDATGVLRLDLVVYWKIDDGTAVPTITRGESTPAYFTQVFTVEDVNTSDPIGTVGTVSENAAAAGLAIGNGITPASGELVFAVGVKEGGWTGETAGGAATTQLTAMGANGPVTFLETGEWATSSGSDIGMAVNHGVASSASAISAGDFGTVGTSLVSLGVFFSITPPAVGGATPRLLGSLGAGR